MEEYLIYQGDAPCGSVRAERQGLYTRFSACCGARKNRLYSLMLEGEKDSILLGVPEWQDGCYVLQRTLANREWERIGAVQCARLTERFAEEPGQERTPAQQDWIRLDHPEYFFRRLTPQLALNGACYWKQAEDGRYLAVPMEDGRPFLLPRYFCFARVERLWGQPYAVFFFDAEEQPRFF